MSKVEREFWALAEGPWAEERGGGMRFRNNWAIAVRASSSAGELAQCVLQLEAALRPIAFKDDWHGKAGEAPTAKPAGVGRTVSRSESVADLQAAGPSEDQEGSQQHEGGQGRWPRSDPYDVRFERPVFGGWEMDRKHHSAHTADINRLPLDLLRKVGLFHQQAWQRITWHAWAHTTLASRHAA